MRFPLPRALSRTAVAAVLIGAPLVACDDPVSNDGETPAELIAYARTVTPGIDAADREIFVVDSDGAEEVRLTHGMRAFGPAWSPDGTRIAFSTLSDDKVIYVMGADGSDQREVVTGPGFRHHVTWSPDGERLVYTWHSGHPDHPEELRTVPADGGEPTTIHVCPTTCWWPAWSPDGSRIAYEVRQEDASHTVEILDLDQSSTTPLGTGFHDEMSPAWSPDGARIVFEGCPDDSRMDCGIFLADPDGSDVRRLTSPGPDEFTRQPSFSRDGTRVVFYQEANVPTATSFERVAGIYTVSLAGDEPRPVTVFGHRQWAIVRPSWQP